MVLATVSAMASVLASMLAAMALVTALVTALVMATVLVSARPTGLACPMVARLVWEKRSASSSVPQ